MPLYPEQASNFAPNVDALMVYITAICLFFAVAMRQSSFSSLNIAARLPAESAFPFTAICGWKSSGWSFL
jgi:hypothetical protein